MTRSLSPYRLDLGFSITHIRNREIQNVCVGVYFHLIEIKISLNTKVVWINNSKQILAMLMLMMINNVQRFQKIIVL